MRDRSREHGTTLIELLVTISLLGALLAITMSGWSSWSAAHEQSGAARQLQSVMRHAQQRAVTEGTTMCVKLDTTADTVTVLRGACTNSAAVRVSGPLEIGDHRVSLSERSAGWADGITFNARGTATEGRVNVVRTGAAKVYTLAVEGLTGRVSLE